MTERSSVEILVLYSTGRGSTAGVAARIAARLRSKGVTVAVHTATELEALRDGVVDRCSALVVGSAIHSGQWLPDMEDALLELVPRLQDGTQVWTFSVSSIGASSTVVSNRLAAVIRPRNPDPRAVHDLRGSVDVRDHRWFAGKVSPGDWAGIGRVVFRLMGGRYGDARDWSDIDSWADRIAAALSERASRNL